ATIGELPAGLPAPVLPDVDLGLLRELAGPVVAVAALAAIESLLSARVASSMTDAGGYDADRELVGQGLASVASGLFGGMPATGAIARTAVNVRSGARTRLAAITHALVLLAVVLVGARVVGQIPLAALAGVLLVTATRMVSWRSVGEVLGTPRLDALVFVLTALVTISVDLVYAVVIGIAVAAVLALRSLSRASGVHREELPGPVADGDDRIALFRLEGALFFGTAERLLDRVAATEGVEVVILRMSQLQLLDATGAQVMADMITALDRRGVTVLVKGVQAHHLLVAGRAGMIAALRHPRHLFDDLADAVEHARRHVRRAAAAREGEGPAACCPVRPRGTGRSPGRAAPAGRTVASAHQPGFTGVTTSAPRRARLAEPRPGRADDPGKDAHGSWDRTPRRHRGTARGVLQRPGGVPRLAGGEPRHRHRALDGAVRQARARPRSHVGGGGAGGAVLRLDRLRQPADRRGLAPAAVVAAQARLDVERGQRRPRRAAAGGGPHAPGGDRRLRAASARPHRRLQLREGARGPHRRAVRRARGGPGGPRVLGGS